ncbi:hypothetical protein ACFYTQ_13550 [Nocardia sp. NPDC004068]|uniref:hypothetical protein n=1 Tax=Nocardia sp. NPDC004068 TaxID=3364303 RepID=UPI003690C513
MLRIRHLVLAAIVATGVTACGESEPTSAPITRTTCDATAANGAVFTTRARPDLPFTLHLPQLRGWQVTPDDAADLVLRRTDRLAGRTGSATITLRVTEPRRADNRTSVFVAYEGPWRQWRSESVQVCGRGGTRSGGIHPASDAEGGDRYHEYLDFDCPAGELLYPIRMLVEATAADRDLYRPDIDSFIDGLQVVPTASAG